MMCVFLGCYWSLSSRWSAALPSYSPIYKDPGGRGLVGWLGDTSAAPSGGAVGRGRCGVASAQSAAGLERAGGPRRTPRRLYHVTDGLWKCEVNFNGYWKLKRVEYKVLLRAGSKHQTCDIKKVMDSNIKM